MDLTKRMMRFDDPEPRLKFYVSEPITLGDLKALECNLPPIEIYRLLGKAESIRLENNTFVYVFEDIKPRPRHGRMRS